MSSDTPSAKTNTVVRSLLNTVFTMFGPGQSFLENAHTVSKLTAADCDVAMNVRHILSTKFVFNHLCANGQFGNAALTPHHEVLINSFYDSINTITNGSFLAFPDALILLTASADVCYSRLRSRDRTEESTVKMSDMEAQVTRYDEFAEWMETNGVRVVRVCTSNKAPDEVATDVAAATLALRADLSSGATNGVAKLLVDGPCGVGKTETAKRVRDVCDELYGLRVHVIDEDVDRWKETGLLGAMLNGSGEK